MQGLEPKTGTKLPCLGPFFCINSVNLTTFKKEDDQKGQKKIELFMNFWQVELSKLLKKYTLRSFEFRMYIWDLIEFVKSTKSRSLNF